MMKSGFVTPAQLPADVPADQLTGLSTDLIEMILKYIGANYTIRIFPRPHTAKQPTTFFLESLLRGVGIFAIEYGGFLI